MLEAVEEILLPHGMNYLSLDVPGRFAISRSHFPLQGSHLQKALPAAGILILARTFNIVTTAYSYYVSPERL